MYKYVASLKWDILNSFSHGWPNKEKRAREARSRDSNIITSDYLLSTKINNLKWCSWKWNSNRGQCFVPRASTPLQTLRINTFITLPVGAERGEENGLAVRVGFHGWAWLKKKKKICLHMHTWSFAHSCFCLAHMARPVTNHSNDLIWFCLKTALWISTELFYT